MPGPDRWDGLLDGLPRPVARTARELTRIILDLHPGLSTKALKGWRALSFRDKRAGYVCGIFPRDGDVMLVFEHGRLLSDPEGLLQGETKQVRHILFAPGAAIPADALGTFIAEAIALRS